MLSAGKPRRRASDSASAGHHGLLHALLQGLSLSQQRRLQAGHGRWSRPLGTAARRPLAVWPSRFARQLRVTMQAWAGRAPGAA
jgi:hypothetical protein